MNQAIAKQCESKKVTGGKRDKTWEHVYLEEGAEGLYIERRGRSNAVMQNTVYLPGNGQLRQVPVATRGMPV